MQEYNTIIGKLLARVNRKKFKRIVDKYNGDFAVKKLNCWEQKESRKKVGWVKRFTFHPS